VCHRTLWILRRTAPARGTRAPARRPAHQLVRDERPAVRLTCLGFGPAPAPSIIRGVYPMHALGHKVHDPDSPALPVTSSGAGRSRSGPACPSAPAARPPAGGPQSYEDGRRRSGDSRRVRGVRSRTAGMRHGRIVAPRHRGVRSSPAAAWAERPRPTPQGSCREPRDRSGASGRQRRAGRMAAGVSRRAHRIASAAQHLAWHRLGPPFVPAISRPPWRHPQSAAPPPRCGAAPRTQTSRAPHARRATP